MPDVIGGIAGDMPEYAIRESTRARRVRFIVDARHGLVVVVPAGFSHDRLPSLIAERRVWIERALATIAERRALLAAGPEALLPPHVELRATGERFGVMREPTAAARLRVLEAPGALSLRGPSHDAEACLAGLHRWLVRAAHSRLVPQLATLAREHGYEYERVRIARQRTRWGSCSARGTISLNRNLLFLPPDVARSVLLHELVHTRRLDHSPRFHAELSAIDPRAAEHRKLLRGAHDLIPAWADVG